MSPHRSISVHWCFLKLILIIGFAVGEPNSNRCVGGGVITPGWTVPKGDIVLEVGTPLEIHCILDPTHNQTKGYSSKDIIFKRGDKTINDKYVTVVNSTTARLYMDDLPISVDNEIFYCSLNLSGGNNTNNSENSTYSASSLEMPLISNEPKEQLICLNSVVIGSKPKEVTNFTCISHNWEVLNCSWVEPKNGIKTNYSIYYMLTRRAGRNQLFGCPSHEERFCEWTMTTTPQYRRTFEFIYFQIDGSNKFGNITQTFKWHNYAHVIPAPPTNLMCLNKTSNSIHLQWNIGMLEVFEKGLTYRIKYAWERSDVWQVIELNTKDVERDKDFIKYNVTGLKYPNMAYDFRIYMKSSVADEQGWSLPSTVVLKTSPCAPYKSPETDLGGFEIHNEHLHRDVIIYWKHIPNEEHNGDNFRYEISVFENDIAVNVTPVVLTDTCAKYTGLSFGAYRFVIRAMNANGTAPQSSVVYVPRKYEILPEPALFTKVDFGDGSYELSWKLANMTTDKISNYTIFWCESNRDYPYPCNSFLNWTHLTAGTFQHNFTAKKHVGYQFAISVNSINSSSGMSWALCTVLHNQVNRIRNVWIGKVGSFYIDFRWKLECAERVEGIKGYNITYCPVNEYNRHKCIGEVKSYLVYGDVTTNHANITNLMPYTMYKMSVSIFTDKTLGPPSDYLYNRTLDGAPDMKNIKIEISNVTASSAVIRWNPPANFNGPLDHYEVIYNEKSMIVNGTTAVLIGLNPYDDYQLRVIACTAVCARTEQLTFNTLIGNPSEVRKVSTEKLNSVHFKLKWEEPSIRGGPNPKYDVRIQLDDPESNSTFDQFETSETSATVKSPCKQEQPTQAVYTFFVRAKNTNDKNASNPIQYYGPWTAAYTIDCANPSSLSTMWKIMIAVFLITLFGSIFGFVGKKGFYKCQQMKKVEVVLPAKFTIPQIFPNDVKDTTYQIDIKSWTDINEIDHLNKLSDAEQSSMDCIDLDVDTDRETSRSSSGCYTS